MYKLALIGMDIGYTRSPLVHAAIGKAIGVDVDFVTRDIVLSELGATVKELSKSVDGIFVTKPYKNDVKRYLSSCDTKCGVNFIRTSDMRGFNTDGLGFIRAVNRAFPSWQNKVNAALVLGAGGAAYSVAEALIGVGKSVYVLNRTQVNAAKLCATLGAELYFNQDAELIVNATTLGLHNEDALSSLCVIPHFSYAFDLIYSVTTKFLRRNADGGATTANGADMLLYQAIEGDCIMLGKKLDVEDVFEKADKILQNDEKGE